MTTFVVYNVESIKIVATCETEGGAKRSALAKNKKRIDTGRSYSYCTREHYDNVVNVMTTTYNMLDPDRKPIPIRLADKGGCCDPATETYHSM